MASYLLWTEEEVPVIEKTDPIIVHRRRSAPPVQHLLRHDLSGTLRSTIESTKMTSTPEVLDQESVLHTAPETRAWHNRFETASGCSMHRKEILSFTSQTQLLQGKAWYLWSPTIDPGTELISLQLLGESCLGPPRAPILRTYGVRGLLLRAGGSNFLASRNRRTVTG